jgi:hypothetical protein
MLQPFAPRTASANPVNAQRAGFLHSAGTRECVGGVLQSEMGGSAGRSRYIGAARLFHFVPMGTSFA